MGVTGSIVVSTSVADVLRPSDPTTPLWRRVKPKLSSVAMHEEMGFQLDGKHTLTLANQTVTNAGLGGSTLRVGFKRALSGRSWIQLGGEALGHSPLAVDVGASR